MIEGKAIKRKDNYFNLDKFKNNILIAIVKHYVEGGNVVSAQSNTNPENPNKKELKELSNMTVDLIKGITEEMSKDIKREISDSILKGEGNLQLAKRLDNIFKGDNPTRFRYEKRLKMIARTEATRARNAGAFNTAEKLGYKKKYIDIVNDERTSDVSKAMFKKYGSKDKAIPLDEEFFVTVKGKEYRGLYPPFMPNDRDFVRFTFD